MEGYWGKHSGKWNRENKSLSNNETHEGRDRTESNSPFGGQK